MNGFAENVQLDVSVPAAQIASDYEAKRTDAWAHIEELNITKRMISACECRQ
jgi:amphiphysin